MSFSKGKKDFMGSLNHFNPNQLLRRKRKKRNIHLSSIKDVPINPNTKFDDPEFPESEEELHPKPILSKKSIYSSKWEEIDAEDDVHLIRRASSSSPGSSGASDTSTSANSNEDQSKFLQFPSKVRKMIWKHLPYKEHLTYRLICHRIKEDIDKRIGVSLKLSDSRLEVLNLMKTIGVRKLYVKNFKSWIKGIPFPYPHLLEHLIIDSAISKMNLAMIVNHTPNIKRLKMVYTRQVPLIMELIKCPLSKSPWLMNLQSISIECSARNSEDINHIRGGLFGLLIENLRDSPIVKISIRIWYNYKPTLPLPRSSYDPTSKDKKDVVPSLILDCHLILGLFLSRHFKSVKEFELTLRREELSKHFPPIKRTSSKTKIVPKRRSLSLRSSILKLSPLFSTLDPQSRALDPSRRTSEAETMARWMEENEKSLHIGKHQFRFKSVDSLNSLTSIDTNVFKMSRAVTSRSLKKLKLKIDGKYFKLWRRFIERMGSLEELYLNLGAGSNWNTYMTSLTNPELCRSLKSVVFQDIGNMKTLKGKSIPASLRHFNKFHSLQNLSISFLQPPSFKLIQNSNGHLGLSRGSGQRSKIQHFKSLPSSLLQFEVNWAEISTLRLFFLIYLNRNLKSLRIGFWSTSNRSFRFGLRMIRWTMKYNLTRLEEIVIIGSQLRFSQDSNWLAVQRLLKSLPNVSNYKEGGDNEARIIINVSKYREANPKRNKNNKRVRNG